jgi:hypothetical protein
MTVNNQELDFMTTLGFSVVTSKQSVRLLAVTMYVLLAPPVTTATLHLKTRSIEIPRDAPLPTNSSAAGVLQHYLARFDHALSTADRDSLSARGIRVGAYVPDDGFVITIERRVAVTGTGITWMAPMDAADKISPMLWNL